MPVLVRAQGLLKTFALAGGIAVPTRQQARLVEHTPNAGRADRHQVGIQHHEAQTAIAFQRVAEVEVEDRALLPVFQPEVAWDPNRSLTRP